MPWINEKDEENRGQAERKEREEMKQVKSYTSIWNVEKVIHAIGDINLLFPVTITQIGYFAGAAVVCFMVRSLPPFVYIKSTVIWIAICIGIAYLMSKKSFDGKNPYRFLCSAFNYLIRPKETYAGKRVIYRKKTVNEYITAVRRDIYVPD